MKKILTLISIFLLIKSDAYCFIENSFNLSNNNLNNVKLEKITGGQLYGVIQIYINQADYNSAITLSKKMIEQYPYIAQGYVLLAKAMSKSGKTENLEEIYTQCIQASQNDSRAYIHRAIIRLKQKRYQEAIRDFDYALNLNDGNWSVENIYADRAVAKYFYGDLTGALNDYDLALAKENSLSDKAQVYFNRGVCRFSMGDKKGAQEDYNKALELNPNAGFVPYF